MSRHVLVVGNVASLPSNDAEFVMQILPCGAIIVTTRTFAMSRCASAVSSFGHAPAGDPYRRLDLQITAVSVGTKTHGFAVTVHQGVCRDVSAHHARLQVLNGKMASHCGQSQTMKGSVSK